MKIQEIIITATGATLGGFIGLGIAKANFSKKEFIPSVAIGNALGNFILLVSSVSLFGMFGGIIGRQVHKLMIN